MFPFLYSRNPDSHKGHYGHALLVAGSLGKMGAAVLAARACLRSGVGLLTVHVPRCGVNIIQTAVPEAMLSIDNDDALFTSLPADLSRYDAVAVGPGLGTDPRTRLALTNLLTAFQELKKKDTSQRGLVIDADGLNNLALMPENMHLAHDAVITPHAMEFQRLFGDADTQQMCNLHELFIVRKGHRSTIYAPDLEPIQNNTGNPGMATAGSGDVLTGVILSLLAQSRAYSLHDPSNSHKSLDGHNSSDRHDSSDGYKTSETVCYSGQERVYIQKLVAWAVYLHGRAGDIAASHRPQASIIASDIIDALLR